MKFHLNIFACSLFMMCLLSVTEAALTNGPTQQEYNFFESADATDMVQLQTGDFAQVINIGTVGSPSGLGYPITLSYHAGIRLPSARSVLRKAGRERKVRKGRIIDGFEIRKSYFLLLT